MDEMARQTYSKHGHLVKMFIKIVKEALLIMQKGGKERNRQICHYEIENIQSLNTQS